MGKIRLGILGVGNQGSMYAKKILGGECPEFELVSIADKNPARIEWVKQNFTNKLNFYTSLDEMLDSNTIDACLVEIPHYDHPSSAIACMRRGVHVCVDKPAGVYTKQIREMNEEAKKHDVVFAMMFNQRTNHVYRKMHELVHSGKYGNIRRTNWLITNWYRPQAYYDSGDWRATWSGEGGGVLMNQCPHQLDMWQWICGMPKTVSAHIKYGQWHDIEVEDDVTAYFEYENGATGTFITTTGDCPGTNRFEIQMDRAKLVAEGEAEYMRMLAEAYDTADKNVAAAVLMYGGASVDALAITKSDYEAGTIDLLEFGDYLVNDLGSTSKWYDTVLADNGETGADWANAIIIDTAEEFVYLAKASGNDTIGKYYKVADGIAGFDLSRGNVDYTKGLAANLNAIKAGGKNHAGNTPGFQGHFDGNGVTVYGAWTNHEQVSPYAGLFSCTKNEVTIKNVNVNQAVFTATTAVVNDSHTHDGRYYTETEADSRFVNASGDTMTGNLTLENVKYATSSATTGVVYSNGIKDMLRIKCEGLNMLTDPVYFKTFVELNGESCDVEFAFAYCDKAYETIYSFVNGGYTPHDGTHVTGFKTAFTSLMNKMAREQEILKDKDKNFIAEMISSHMGIWTTDYNGNEVLPKPKDKYQRFVHMCDYLASRKVIGIKFDINFNNNDIDG